MRATAPFYWTFALALTAGVTDVRSAPPAGAPELAFNRDIRPILSDNCFQCHGPDKNERKADLRLDSSEQARAHREGGPALVPGKPDESGLFRRITHNDPDERMPPADSGRALSSREIALLRQWIEQGGRYQSHWAFIPPQRPEAPSVRATGWPRNSIDAFVLAQLERQGLTASPAADKTTLIRRATLDITGLPPTLEAIDAFLADSQPHAYERVVDRLLASEHYGEHMASPWLDAARYADTNGYNNDTPRYNWRWRDWVIEAFNRNIPFDRFIAAQLAGDLIPNATLSDKIATGFNRNHNITSEGGIIDEEYRLEYVADRVQTAATVFLALSLRCARCHDHKFDPISQNEYYRFFAFFNQVPEKGYHKEHVGNVKPVMPAPTPDQSMRLDKLTQKVAALKKRIAQHETQAEQAAPEWEKQLPAEARSIEPLPPGSLVHLPLDGGVSPGHIIGTTNWVEGKFDRALQFDGKTHVDLGDTAGFDGTTPFSYGAWVFPAAGKAMNILSRMKVEQGHRGFDLTFENGPVSVHLIHQSPADEIKVQTRQSIERKRWTHVFATYDGSQKAAGIRIYFDGKPQELKVHNDQLQGTIRADAALRIGKRTESVPFQGAIDETLVYPRELSSNEVARIAARQPLPFLLAIKPSDRTDTQQAAVRQRYLEEQDAEYPVLTADLQRLEERETKLRREIPTAMVMKDLAEMRDTFVLARGQYDKPGEKVPAGVPKVFPPLPSAAPANRLGLAQWLARPDHPLTARVAVNRLWYLLFGRGIVETLEDFGSQGAWPTHPDLLDWLATEMVRLNWDTKAMVKLIVTSATYRQSSRVSPELAAVDPDNQLLARGPRFRMRAEMIRDNALALSGLLHHHIGGPSVRPYQPPGLWVEVSVADDSYSGGPYKQDTGPSLYRRAVYTWWKRTCPPPALNTFDAPEREFCAVRRSRSNTPLQALVLLNDPTFVEAARKMAERIMREGGTSVRSRATFAFRLATARLPKADEMEVLLRVFQRQRERYAQDEEAVQGLLTVGDSKADSQLDPRELAAWTTLASMILNLDEVITKG